MPPVNVDDSTFADLLPMIDKKSRVAAAHLCISLVIAVAAALLVLYAWFPFPYSELSRGRPLFFLIVSVDVVLGPLLTWIVFNPSKKNREKIFDLSVIAIVQASALAYGMHAAYLARPIYLVHEVDRLVVVTAADVDGEMHKAPKNLQEPNFGVVKLIGVRELENPQERMKSVELALAGRDISLRPEYWQDLSAENRRMIEKRSKPLPELLKNHPEALNGIEKLASELKKDSKDLVYLPVVGKGVIWSAVMEAGQSNILGYVKADGF
jgi:hypothetical protein